MKKKIAIIIISVILVAISAWVIWGNVTFDVTHYSVSSDRLPKKFDGYKIAVLSDLHNAKFGKDKSRLLAIIERENPDIIAITGDLVDSRKTNIETAQKLCTELTNLAPCYYVAGNHEAWLKEDYNDLEKKLRFAGVIILRDIALKLTNDEETIKIAGLFDPRFSGENSFTREMLKSKIEDMKLTGEYCILLSHRPEAFESYVSENIDLVLSGHTHGGLIRLPRIGGIIAPNQGFFPKYDAGKFTEDNTTMIVSRGIGNSGFSLRINNKPELVIVELKSEK